MRRGKLVKACLLCQPPAYTVEQDEIEEPMTFRSAAAPYSLSAINIQVGKLEDFLMSRRDVGMDSKEMKQAIEQIQMIDQNVGKLMRAIN